MKRHVVVALCALVPLGGFQAVAASPYPKMDWRVADGALLWETPRCGVASTRVVNLGRRVADFEVRKPRVGDPVEDDYGTPVGTVTAIEPTISEGRTSVAVTMVGTGSACPAPSDETIAGMLDTDIEYWTRLPKGQRRFHAWTPDGEPTVRIAGRYRFDCQIQSLKTPRVDAWRCGTADPCFSRPTNERQVLCVNSPWSAAGILITTHPPAREPRITGIPGPWVLETQGRLRCSWLSGVTLIRANRRLNYGCWRKGRAGRPAGFLYGKPRRGTILHARDNESPLRRRGIRLAWN